MVQAGMAEVYHGKMVKEFDVAPYLKAEQEAKNKKLGIWSLKTTKVKGILQLKNN